MGLTRAEKADQVHEDREAAPPGLFVLGRKVDGDVALVGIAQKALLPELGKWFSVTLQTTQGWIAVLLLVPLARRLPLEAVGLMALVFMVLIAVTFISLGLIFASKMRDIQGFSIVMNFVIFPLFFLSGALYPLENFPAWLRYLSRIDPLTYGVDGLRGVLIGVSSLPVVANFIVMSIFSAIMIVLGAYFFEKSKSV